MRLLSRLLFLPLVAGLSYELLRFAAKYDNLLTRIIRAPGMALQYITTKEPTRDMLEVAIAAFHLAMLPEEEALAAVKENRAEKAAREAQAAQGEAPGEGRPAPETAAQEETSGAEAPASEEAAPERPAQGADGPAQEAAE